MALDLEAIRARAEAATPGPWQVDMETDGDGEPMGEWWTYPVGVDQASGGKTVFRFDDDYGTDQLADAQFIAAARTDVPALVAEVERLREALDEAQLRSIEARNPGIDMEEVKRVRKAAP